MRRLLTLKIHQNAGGPLISFVGTDGSGKSTMAKRIKSDLDHMGLRTKYIWFGRPYFFALPLLYLGRVLRLTKIVSDGKYRMAIHDFHREPFKSLYSIAVFTDVVIQRGLKISFPSRFGVPIICDRWVYDITVDVTINTRNPNFEYSLIGRLLNRIASTAAFVVFLCASDAELDRRRPESKLDPLASDRRRLYHSLAERHVLYTISSDDKMASARAYNGLVDILARTIGLRTTKTYGSKNPFLRPFLKNRAGAIAANWLFQGTLIMQRGELAFRFMIEGAFAAGIFLALSAVFSTKIDLVLSLLIAHTINWTLNGNLWGTQKFFGRKSSISRSVEFLLGLKQKAAQWSDCIATIAAFGSLSRGEFTESSDLDIRVIRVGGALNWVLANVFAFSTRSSAFLGGIPLDMFLLDRADQIYEHISRAEPAVVIYDPYETLSKAGKTIPLLDRGWPLPAEE